MSPSPPDLGTGAWVLVVPVKRLASAKTRLAALAGPLRPELALGFAADTVRAALACPPVAGVVVVTDEPAARSELTALGALVVPDEPDAGLNPALAYGAGRARKARPGASLGALAADLPALRPAELAIALDAAATRDHVLVPDAAGTGTTLLTARAPADLRPAFGPGSRAAHLAAGAVDLAGLGLESLRRDVDTERDLRAALRLGVGPRTRETVARLPSLAV